MMTPRLRTLVADGDHTVLVIDRCEVTNQITSTQVRDAIAAAKVAPFSGVLVFPFEVELPGDDFERTVEIHPDERAALRRLSEVARGTAGAEWRASDVAVLDLLIGRIEERS